MSHLRQTSMSLLSRIDARLRSVVISVARRLAEERVVVFDYPVRSVPRWGHGKPEHPQLQAQFDARREFFAEQLRAFLDLREYLVRIPTEPDAKSPTQPAWNTPWLMGLDAVALYAFVANSNPKRYFEIGSGHSTKFVRRAIEDHHLRTAIISVDPAPRAEIDGICDRLLRMPAEEVEFEEYDSLASGDILFIDNSHRVLMNSDATAIFLDVLPRLPPGVLVHFHDIFLPSDYPPEWSDRFYSEQYVLAAYLIAEWERVELILPNAFVTGDKELSDVLSPLWAEPALRGVQACGGSFWLTMR